MSNRIVTISRQFGSGGRTIGKALAEKLGIPCYDQEIIAMLAEKSGFSPEYIQEEGEYAPHSNWIVNSMAPRAYNALSNQDQLWIAQRKIILELAEKESCVIVGRCADAILAGKADCLTVFVHADMDARAKRIVEVYGETNIPTERRLRDKDKRRANYYQFYTDLKWGDVNHYHVALDSGVLGIDPCVALLAQLY